MELGLIVDLAIVPYDEANAFSIGMTPEERKQQYRSKRSNRYKKSVYTFRDRVAKKQILAQPYFQD